MIDHSIINKWLEAKSDEALSKLLNKEPLSFEDNFVFCLIGQREEIRQLREEMNERFGAVDKRFGAVDKQFEAVDKRFEQIDKRFEQIDKRFEAVDRKIDAVEQRVLQEVASLQADVRSVQFGINDVGRRFEQLRKDMNAQTWRMIGLTTLLAALIKLFDYLR